MISKMVVFFIMIYFTSILATSANGEEKLTIFLTSKGTTDRLTNKGSVPLHPTTSSDEDYPTVFIDPEKHFQTILGMGGAITDAVAEVFYKLPTSAQKELMSAYFDPISGIGYTLARTNIHSCDFSSESYEYAPAGDTELKHFSIQHDLKYRVPFIKSALQASRHQLTIFASPWSPPSWMKTNNSMLNGGKLAPKYFKSWANYYLKFVEEYQKQGIDIWGITVQNEPMATQTWESCLFTAAEEKDFVKLYLGPTIKNSRFKDLKIMVWDHNRDFMYARAKEIYDDPVASEYVWGMAFHWYVGDHFDNLRAVHDSYPDKALLFTEGCNCPFNKEKLHDWNWGEIYGRSIINDLNNWSVGFTDWNILLDENGGPNHVKNYCYAPIHADTQNGSLIYTNSYYYIGHFSKFIRPGAKRIACSSTLDNLKSTAFINREGKIVVVAMNESTENIDFKLSANLNNHISSNSGVKYKVAKLSIPAHSIMTILLPSKAEVRHQ